MLKQTTTILLVQLLRYKSEGVVLPFAIVDSFVVFVRIHACDMRWTAVAKLYQDMTPDALYANTALRSVVLGHHVIFATHRNGKREWTHLVGLLNVCGDRFLRGTHIAGNESRRYRRKVCTIAVARVILDSPVTNLRAEVPSI
jgi:hypothetical protein